MFDAILLWTLSGGDGMMRVENPREREVSAMKKLICLLALSLLLGCAACSAPAETAGETENTAADAAFAFQKIKSQKI